ncbi:paraneoplastic antigen Ma2-like [Lampris incognitus]|uniref:paraneoplastic antigen Ma2-like n=1 Tax=Lampris incognitus TaxID=2546036 RepID=UPI0024B488EB|nr:paraneoplastic antigen Ma2-like [Lampris incognitus]
MAGQTSSPSQLELVNWCRGERLNVEHALLVYGVPEETTIAEIEETVGAVKVLGKVAVKGKMFNSQHQSLMVLCECREVIDPTTVPPEIPPLEEGGSAWKMVYYTEEEEAETPDDFAVKLSQFLQHEGKTMDDIPRLGQPTIAGHSSPESIIRAVGDVWGKSSKPPDSSSYRHLRTFSGVSPTPTGEESLDLWLEQAKVMVDEGECSEKEKRRRILESLKGPALEIIQAVHMTDADASPMEYIQAIESIFGTFKSGEDLYFSFRSLRKSLLKVRERKDDPPTFLSLLQEIREEEECQSDRQSLGATTSKQRVRAVQVEKETEPEMDQQSELRDQIKELTAKMDEQMSNQCQQRSDRSQGGSKKKQTRRVKKESHSDMESLGQQVKALEEKIRVMSVRPKSENTRETTTQSRRSAPGHRAGSSKEYFCYRCAENGHITPKCSAPENAQKVIKKLVRLVRGPKDKLDETPKTSSEEETVARTHKLEVSEEGTGLPGGLLGPSSIYRTNAPASPFWKNPI